MHDGLREELQEIWDEDRVYRDYSRFGSLHRELQGLSPGVESPGAIELHQKEFGDVSWYLANRLSLQGVPFSRAVVMGQHAHAEYAGSITTCSPAFIAEAQDRLPAIFFAHLSHQMLTASVEAIKRPTQPNIESLGAAAGQLVLSMSQIVSVRLGVNYTFILDQNIAKIRRRIENKTVFDKTGGDIR